MVSHKPDSDKYLSQKLLLSEFNAELRSISSDPDDEVFWEGMLRSAANVLI